MKIFAETKRLIVREVMASDADGFFELDSDPEVHTYLGNAPLTNIEQSRATIAFIQQQYRLNGIGRWAVVEKQSNKFIGWAGLKLVTETTNGHINYYDLGYRFMKRYWGKGFASESAKASREYGFNQLQLNEIYAMTDSNNTASGKVLEKTGFKFIEKFFFENALHDWFKITKP